MKIQHILYLLIISLLTLTSCGRKGPLEHPKDEKRPKFNRVSDELELTPSQLGGSSKPDQDSTSKSPN